MKRWFEILEQDGADAGAAEETGETSEDGGANSESAGDDNTGDSSFSGNADSSGTGESAGEATETTESKGPEPPPWLKQASRDNQDREELWSLSKIDDLIAERDKYKDSSVEVPEKYNYSVDENDDKEATEELAKRAKEAGLTQEQFDTVQDFLNERTTDVIKETQKYIGDGYTTESASDLFQREWGKDFNKKFQAMRRGVRILGGDSILEILNKTGLGNNPTMVRALSNLGEMFSEDDTPLSESEGGMVNDEVSKLKERYPSMF